MTYQRSRRCVRALVGDEPRARIEELLDGHEPGVRALMATLWPGRARRSSPRRSPGRCGAAREGAEERLLLLVIDDLH